MSLTLHEALTVVIARTGVDRYRFLCLHHPDAAVRESYSAWVLSQATGEPAPPPKAPGLAAKAVSAAKAAARFAASGARLCTPSEREARLAVCRACPEYDAARGLCRRCGCHTEIKLRMASESCPLGNWDRID